MKQNGNHHASAILRTFTQGNLRQRTGNFNSFTAMYGTPRYDVTSRIMGLFPVTFYMEVSTSFQLQNRRSSAKKQATCLWVMYDL